jgi:hypothetical protein
MMKGSETQQASLNEHNHNTNMLTETVQQAMQRHASLQTFTVGKVTRIINHTSTSPEAETDAEPAFAVRVSSGKDTRQHWTPCVCRKGVGWPRIPLPGEAADP